MIEFLSSSDAEVLRNTAPSLKGATVLVCGANGNVGSKVVRELLRTTGAAQVRAVVSRTLGIEGYGKLSYEVGAEDGTGTIQPIWQSMDVTMEYNEERQGTYNLDRLTLLQGDVLDEEFAEKAVAGVDAVVYCVAETGPVAGLSFFRKLRAEANKSVESDGVANMAAALARQLRKRGPSASSRPQPSARFVLLSSAITRALPLQRSIGGVQQRRGEEILASGETGVPSFAVVRSFPYDDFYTEEVGVENVQCALLKREASSEGGQDSVDERSTDDEAAAGGATAKVPAITPRDAARFLVSALTDADLTDTVVEIWAGPGAAKKSGSSDGSQKEAP